MSDARRAANDQRAHADQNVQTDRRQLLRIHLLGGFRASLGERVIEESEWRLRKSRNLIKLLALAPGNRLHRETLLDTLWPDLPPEAAANNLHYVLHVARSALAKSAPASSTYLKLRRDEVVLCSSRSAWVDVSEFEKAAAKALRSANPADYEAALHLYTGELLPEDRYEDWAQSHRERLRQLHVTLLLRLAHLWEERGEARHAIEILQRTVAQEPLHEEAHRELMRLYWRGGQHQQAKAQYWRLTVALQTELGMAPDSTTVQLYNQILANATESPPSAARVRQQGVTASHNLPIDLTSFIGREREIEQLKVLLRTARLLTLVGPGGSGKTRLALKVASDLTQAYTDGVSLVDLTSITDPGLVEQAVARALAVREQSGRALMDALVEHLRDDHRLILLDNCEQVIGACAQLAQELLSTCGRLQIVATSREPLGNPGETIIPSGSLSLPNAGTTLSPQTLLRYESVRLFVERARYRQPSFALTEENAANIAEICRRLDGMPLAIELAAARVAMLPIPQIASRLHDSLGLLAGGSRTVAQRHRTMRSLLDWSYNLLDEHERLLFTHLSVFVGGWTLEAAEAIDPLHDTLDVLARLVDKSLIIAEERGHEVRYRMLIPVRQYAQERLEQTGEADTVLRRHATLFLELAERAEQQLAGAQQVEWLRRLEIEQDNLRAALSWSLGHHCCAANADSELGIRLAATLWPFWRTRGYLLEGRRWLENALRHGNEVPMSTRARLLLGVGLLAWQQSDLNQAKGLLEESMRLQRETGNSRGIAEVLNYLGAVAHHQGDYAQAEEFYKESLTLRRNLGDQHAIAASLNNLGLVMLSQENLSQAESLLEESVNLAQQLGDRWSAAYALDSLGIVALTRREFERARRHFEASLRIVQEMDDKWCIVACLDGLAAVAEGQGQPLRASRLWGAAEALRKSSGISISPAWQSTYEARVSAARAQADAATWTSAWSEGLSMPLPRAIQYALSPPTPSVSSPTFPKEVASGSLTRREREIATLIAEGLTNRQIADQLVLSERTVDAHVRRVLSKLALSSRKQVREWVETHRRSD